MEKISLKRTTNVIRFNQFAFVSNSGVNDTYEFNLKCSLTVGQHPGCSGRKRRSTEDTTDVSIGYKIETPSANMEQIGNIVTVKKSTENGLKAMSIKVLFLIVAFYF